MERRLRLAGYDVATYASAQDLLDRLPDDDKPGCVLLDVQIPGLSGPDLFIRLQALFPEAEVVRTDVLGSVGLGLAMEARRVFGA